MRVMAGDLACAHAPPAGRHQRTHARARAQDAVVIGARFDVDTGGEACRLAFYGRLAALLPAGTPEELRRLRVYKVTHTTALAASCCEASCSALAASMLLHRPLP